MPKTLPHVLAWLLLAPCTLAQQQDQQPQVARKSGTIYKKQVDGLIGALRTTARRGEAGIGLRTGPQRKKPSGARLQRASLARTTAKGVLAM